MVQTFNRNMAYLSRKDQFEVLKIIISLKITKGKTLSSKNIQKRRVI